MENTSSTPMSQPHKLTPHFFFLSLGVIVSLIVSVTSFLTLIFEVLNKQFPDALNATYSYGYFNYDYQTIRGAMSTLIIVFPVFVILTYFWRKVSRTELGRVDDIIRKWMMYLILFLSSIVVVVDLVTLVKYFVAGEITTRFILKVVSALVIAAIVGSYYLFELRNKVTKTINWYYAIKSSILVIALIVCSFFVIGSPTEQRDLRFDQRRTEDLQNIQWQVVSFWQQKEKLPEKIDELSNPISSYMVPRDPEFQKGMAYEYKKTAPMTFELCATFSRPMPEGWQDYGKGGIMPMYSERDVAVSYPYPGGGMNESWDHETGRTCFSRTIDPEIYPPFPKPDEINKR